MNRGIIYSICLHALLLLVVFFGIPSLFDKKILEDTVVTVEVLPVSALSNVKPPKAQPELPKPALPKPEPAKPEPAKPEPAKKEEPLPAPPKKEPPPKVEPVKMDDVVPVKPVVKPKPPKKEEPKKEEPKKPEPKKEEPKKPEPKKEKPKEADPFASLEKDLEKKADQKQKQEAFDNIEHSLTKQSTKTYDSSVPLSISETDAIRQQFFSCWTPPVGARDLEDMVAVVHVVIEKDGTVSEAKLEANAHYNGNSFYRVFAESALRAVQKCSPLKVMPSPDKFGSWHEMELTFTPKDMFNNQ